MRRRINGYISAHTETRVSAIHGKGLFATKNLSKGTIVAVWGGKILTKQEVYRLSAPIGNSYALEVYPKFYLAETNVSQLDSSDFINHSCEPNCVIRNILVMITRHKILKGDELTANFSSPSGKGKKTRCTCGAKKCKRIVRF